VMTTTDLRVGELTAPAAISVRLWPLDDIAERYQRPLNLAEKRRAQLRGRHKLSRTEYLTIALELAAEFTAAMEPDPLLPSELLPGAWIGARARAVFAQCWIELRARTDETVPQLSSRAMPPRPAHTGRSHHSTTPAVTNGTQTSSMI
jgi:phenylacetic acid degradation operon negative regulatory protein